MENGSKKPRLQEETEAGEELNYKREGVLPDTLVQFIEARRRETSGRRFRVITIPPQEFDLSVKDLMLKRSLTPLLSNVYLPLDISALQLPEYPELDEEEEDNDENEKKKGKEEEDIRIFVAGDTEILIYHPYQYEPVSITQITNSPLLYGTGALYSQLGIERSPSNSYGNNICISAKLARKAGATSSMVLFVQIENLDEPYKPLSSSPPYLCLEVCKKEGEGEDIYKLYDNGMRLDSQRSGSDEDKQLIERWRTGRGVLHKGYCGKDLVFSIYDTETKELVYPAYEISVGIRDRENKDSGPVCQLIPAGFRHAAFCWYEFSARWAPGCNTHRDLMEHVRTILRKAGFEEQPDDEDDDDGYDNAMI